MKLLVVIAVCVVSAMAMPRENLLAALRRVLDDSSTRPPPPEMDLEAGVGIEGVRMMDWTVMEILEEGCIRRHSRGPPPPMTTEAPEDNPERQLLNALKRMIGDGTMEPHPRASNMMRALDRFCGALMERFEESSEEEDSTTIAPSK